MGLSHWGMLFAGSLRTCDRSYRACTFSQCTDQSTHFSLPGLQATALAKAGFRVIAPDLRGSIGGESDAPQEVEAYDIPKVVVKDVAGKSSIVPSSHNLPQRPVA